MKERVEIVIALGTNNDHEISMFKAQQQLEVLFKDVVFTQQLWTDPIGSKGQNLPMGTPFLNCLAIAHTNHGAKQVASALKRIEVRCGDTRAHRMIGVVRMDVDLLLYNGERYHEEDWNRSYIQTLMKEIEAIRNTAEDEG